MSTEVYLPKSTPNLKIEKIKALGGKVILFGDAWDEANQEALHVAKNSDKYVYIHTFSDDDVINGQATVALEILKEQKDIDIIVTSIGGGGLVSGVSQYAKDM